MKATLERPGSDIDIFVPVDSVLSEMIWKEKRVTYKEYDK